MLDPDMGGWYYGYDNNGNLTGHLDDNGKTISMAYDNINRLTNKNYPSGSGMTNVTNKYDSTAGGNYGKGKRTSMTDYFGSNSQTWTYDARGRLISESKVVDSNTYTTGYSYDGADRISTITYPTSEVVTQTYDLRGLPYSLSGTTAGTLVNSAFYNQLGSMPEINMGSSTVLQTTYGYYGTGGTYDTTGGYYGRLWEIKSTKQPGGSPVLYDIRYTWDANGNLTNRSDQVSPYSDSGTFSYDYFNRLTLASVDYTENYAYDLIGNLLSKGGSLYSYGAKPHAVTSVGSTSYVYDNNGNMTTWGRSTITYDLENKPVTITGGRTYYYDGDGNRVKEVDTNTYVYIGKFYEKNISTSEVTTHYYLGNKQIAVRKGSTVSYLIQDQVSSTSAVADTGGNSTGTMRYYPFGECRKFRVELPEL